MALAAMQSQAGTHVPAARSAAAPLRQTVVCTASASSSAPARRAMLGGIATLPFVAAPFAKAILLDEDDEEMIERAKANRKARLASQKETTREFMKSEGLTNRELNKELIPVQKAVYNLAKSGSQLEAGDVRAAAATLSGSWVDDFKQASTAFPTVSATPVLDGLASLKEAASAEDLSQSKRTFVTVASALESWAQDVGVADSLKGL